MQEQQGIETVGRKGRRKLPGTPAFFHHLSSATAKIGRSRKRKQQVCEPPAKTCGGCKERAYCSKKCQSIDWKITGTGQRHKNWCGLYEHGEEDIDWEVALVPSKGLGVRTKSKKTLTSWV